jgi:hypothetical protein
MASERKVKRSIPSLMVAGSTSDNGVNAVYHRNRRGLLKVPQSIREAYVTQMVSLLNGLEREIEYYRKPR